MSPVWVRRRSADLAAFAVWLVYASIYALTFALSGAPSIAVAIRAAFANAIPDGFLGLAAHRTVARDRSQPSGHGASRPAARAEGRRDGRPRRCRENPAVLARLHHRRPERVPDQPGVLAWQVFLSALIYVTVAATSHAWLIARRLREEEANAVRAEALRARAEIAALRAQLNPHFLFNTLHSVLGLVRSNPALAEAALEKLGDLLRYATRVHRNGVDWIAFRHEQEFVDT